MHSSFGHGEYQVILISLGCFDNLLSCKGGYAKWTKNLSSLSTCRHHRSYEICNSVAHVSSLFFHKVLILC